MPATTPDIPSPDPGSAGELERVLVELREANERLVIVSVRMQEMTEQAERRRLEAEAGAAETAALHRLGRSFSQELDQQKLVQLITDEATALCGADFGAMFFNVTNERGASFQLYTLSGAEKDAFAGFPLPRATPIFAPTFQGEGVVRIGNVRDDPRFGAWGPQPKGHLLVTSYLAVPVVSQSEGVLGGLFFAHRAPDQFTERHERMITGLAGLAAIALDNARLYESLQNVNRVKDVFLATLSHELRTPLSAILGWSRILLSGISLPEGRRQEALAAIDRNARVQAQLIDDLLDVSRIISGKLELHADSVPLGPIVEAAIDTVRMSAAAKRVELQVVSDPDTTILVKGDAARLQQIAWNLVSNAVKFTPAGGLVKVELRRMGGDVLLVVRDTGEGIAADFLPHVFERFRQSDSRPSRRHGGLGLGLAIARHLCEAHGGTVTATSEGVGKGATFTVRLPLESIVAREAATAPSAPITDAPVLAGCRVLIVDDDADARFLMGEVLTADGAEVTEAASVRDALRAMRARRFDALLADIGMPGEDGYVLIRTVRALAADQGGRIPAVAVTAYASSRDRERTLAAGFDAHVPKPVEAPNLVSAIANVLHPDKQHAAGRRN